MRHAGKARKAGIKIIAGTFAILALLIVVGFLATVVGSVVSAVATLLFGLWVIFAIFALNFFRDPNPVVPTDPRAIVSPAHGTVDVIDETDEMEFMGTRCRRISIFL